METFHLQVPDEKIDKMAKEIFAARLWDRRFKWEIKWRWDRLHKDRKHRYFRAAIWSLQAYLGE